MRSTAPRTAGWRERVALPQLGLLGVIAKLDTGARTSALHVAEVEVRVERGRKRVRFKPLDRDEVCTADLHAERRVRDSGGRSATRCVIVTRLRLDGRSWPIELTLTSRATLRYALLLGRSALADRITVDPGATYLLSAALPRRRRSRA